MIKIGLLGLVCGAVSSNKLGLDARAVYIYETTTFIKILRLTETFPMGYKGYDCTFGCPKKI